MSNPKFAMIGSGRVASHLAPALVDAGFLCTIIYSPNISHAQSLAGRIGTIATDDLKNVVGSDVDFVLLSIKDDALSEVTKVFPEDYPHPLIHTSGSTPMDVLNRVSSYGVIYPMQTFSKERSIDVSQVPFFYEWSNEHTRILIEEIFIQLNVKTFRYLKSEDRGRLHLAAVFACNFTNYLFSIADHILGEMDLDFNILSPLVTETIEKAFLHHPENVQTGPASRNDTKTMERHLALLDDHPEYKKLYKILSESIIARYNKQS